MGSIFKKFGQGLLYILVLPLFLLAITIFGVYGIGLFIVLMIKSIISFFKGKSLYEDLPEDIEAQRILHPEKVTPKVESHIEEREEYVVIDRGSERYGELEERPRPSEISEPRREEIPLAREDSRREIDEPSVDDEEDDTPLFDEVEIDDDIEEIKETDIEEIGIEELEEDEEEDIPTLKGDSKIKEDDEDIDDDSSSGVSITDWRK